jgi:hypothetical protein
MMTLLRMNVSPQIACTIPERGRYLKRTGNGFASNLIGVYSVTNPLKLGWRSMPSSVTPRNSIRADSFGSTQTVSLVRSGLAVGGRSPDQRLKPHVLSTLHREADPGLASVDEPAGRAPPVGSPR